MTPPPPAPAVPLNYPHILLGGALMGVANIIPGVSGGTMILALGLYERFVSSVAAVTRLRPDAGAWVFLGVLLAGNVMGLFGALIPITWGLENHHHIMYALFIGLTLGGVPIVLAEMGRMGAAGIAGTVAGIAVMLAVAYALSEFPVPQNFATFLVAGAVASAAMVLPGISGSYLLLIVGMYGPITRAMKDFFRALASMDLATAFGLGWSILLPVGLGVLIGIAGLTNGLQRLLVVAREATLGVLLGLLLGSVVGLYPFGQLVEKGEVIAEAHPITPVNIVLVLVALAAGFVATQLIGRLGGEPGHAKA